MNEEVHEDLPEVITNEMIQCSTNIKQVQKDGLVSLISKYRFCFALSIKEIECRYKCIAHED